MDPDTCLAEIRNILELLGDHSRRWADGVTGQAPAPRINALEDLAEKVQALDEWIGDGGFLPRDWSVALARALAVRPDQRLPPRHPDEP